MPHNLHEWQGRIKAVEREYAAMRLASNRLLEQFRHDPGIFGKSAHLGERDLKNASDHLDGTYLIRLFAEFETGLRSYWASVKNKTSPNRTRDLLEGIAASRSIPDDVRENAHSVRDYRNALIHHREGDIPSVSVSESRAHLCIFLARLPPSW